jgi:orotidine-5'-phosphate decarboxylase
MRPQVEPPVCIALDVGDLAAAEAIVDKLGGLVPVFKVGLELFTAAGPRAVEAVLSRRAEVFLDLKVNDIPQQAAGAVRAAADIGVSYLTVHSNAGRATVRAATDASQEDGPKILVVSVLTSLDDEGLREVGVERPTGDQVAAMARLASDEGAPGLVLGAGEVESVRRTHPGLFLVTPGIRPAAADVADQRRVGTPGAAVAAGADMLVVGRPVTGATDPAGALEAILREIAEARGRAVSKAGA